MENYVIEAVNQFTEQVKIHSIMHENPGKVMQFSMTFKCTQYFCKNQMIGLFQVSSDFS